MNNLFGVCPLPFLDPSNDPISTKEIEFSILQVPSHKMPGLDDFPVEKYVNVKQMLKKSIPP